MLDTPIVHITPTSLSSSRHVHVKTFLFFFLGGVE